jgi:hypothetical protein
MNVQVLYDGHRKSIRIDNPNILVQEIIEDASKAFKVNANACILKYRKTEIPKSQPLRLCNVPNNALLELHLTSTSNLNKFTKIALSIPNGKSHIKSYDSSFTLMDVLQSIINDNVISENVINMNPQFIYMRNSYSRELLQSVTLVSLGLAG